MSLAACISRWPCTNPLAVVAVATAGQVSLKNRRCGLLDLQEEPVAGILALEQRDERPGARAPDAHHLAGDIDDLELLQEVAPVRLERGAVRLELLTEHLIQVVRGKARNSGRAAG
jgi:hypothetical protein